MSQFTQRFKTWPAKGLSVATRAMGKTPLGLVVIGFAILPLLVFDWSPSDAALRDPELEPKIKSATVPYLPLPPVDAIDFPPPKFTKTVRARKGDTLSTLLAREGVSLPEAHRAIQALSKHYNPKMLQLGQELTLYLMPQTSEPGDNRLTALILRPSTFIEISLKRLSVNQFKAEKRRIAIDRRLVRTGGTIRTNLYIAARDAGVPAPVLMELIRIYSWDVDFQRGIRPGDKFEILFETLFTEDGEFARYGEILYGNLVLGQSQNPLYRYKTKKGLIDYFNTQGQSARKALMRTPINGARLSSGFGKRRHPILGYTKMHRGLDFAAPRGTPIYAAGDGVIVRRGRNGGYGHYIRIRHNSDFETAYAHLSRYHARAKIGRRVRQGQIIGFVGTTGRSTGPHLHYEILRHNRQVNPLRVKMPSGTKLRDKELARFESFKDKTTEQYATASRPAKVAHSAGRKAN